MTRARRSTGCWRRRRFCGGIRQQFHWHQNREYRFAPQPDLCSDPAVQRNIARLGEYDLTFDLQVFASQMPGAAALAEACPDVTFIVQHAGMPEDLSEDGINCWDAGMRALANCANVCVKLSGLGTFVRRNDPELIASIVGRMVAVFGPERCMFGSNFPIEKIWTDFASLAEAYRAACRELSEPAREIDLRKDRSKGLQTACRLGGNCQCKGRNSWP